MVKRWGTSCAYGLYFTHAQASIIQLVTNFSDVRVIILNLDGTLSVRHVGCRLWCRHCGQYVASCSLAFCGSPQLAG